MKRVFCLAFMICMLISSVVFAECNLDTTRWRWVGSDSSTGLFYDRKTFKFLNNGLVELWTCQYHPNSCDEFSGEHYHYILARLNFNDNLIGGRVYLVRDLYGKIIDNQSYYDFSYSPVLPNSVGEALFFAVRQDVFGK